jgi:hypothetical protein
MAATGEKPMAVDIQTLTTGRRHAARRRDVAVTKWHSSPASCCLSTQATRPLAVRPFTAVWAAAGTAVPGTDCEVRSGGNPGTHRVSTTTLPNGDPAVKALIGDRCPLSPPARMSGNALSRTCDPSCSRGTPDPPASPLRILGTHCASYAGTSGGPYHKTTALVRQRAPVPRCRDARLGRAAEASRGSKARTRCVGTTYAGVRWRQGGAPTPSLSQCATRSSEAAPPSRRPWHANEPSVDPASRPPAAAAPAPPRRALGRVACARLCRPRERLSAAAGRPSVLSNCPRPISAGRQR